ncbi:hypothetical protein [Streptomyces longispororuber]|nr:hypothetical protein [Streptomyces longispororuber]
MDKVMGLQDAHTHQQSYQDALQSKVTGFQENQKQRDTSFADALSGLCSIPMSIAATVPPDVTRFDPKGSFC